MQRSLAAAMSRTQDDALCDGAEDVAAEVAAVRAVVLVPSRHRFCVVRPQQCDNNSAAANVVARQRQAWQCGGVGSARGGAMIADVTAWARGNY